MKRGKTRLTCIDFEATPLLEWDSKVGKGMPVTAVPHPQIRNWNVRLYIMASLYSSQDEREEKYASMVRWRSKFLPASPILDLVS